MLSEVRSAQERCLSLFRGFQATEKHMMDTYHDATVPMPRQGDNARKRFGYVFPVVGVRLNQGLIAKGDPMDPERKV